MAAVPLFHSIALYLEYYFGQSKRVVIRIYSEQLKKDILSMEEIKQLALLLGHAGLKHTEKYTRAVDSLKREAIYSLPDISF